MVSPNSNYWSVWNPPPATPRVGSVRLSDQPVEPEAVANFAEALDSKRRVRDGLIRAIARERPDVAARLISVEPIAETIAKSADGPANPLGEYLLAQFEDESVVR